MPMGVKVSTATMALSMAAITICRMRSLWFLREAKYLNNPRSLLGTSCAISGTGFLIHRDILNKQKGWKHFLLTEDIEFSVDNVLQGEKIGTIVSNEQ